jgi:serine protease inhibitor
MYMLTKSHSPYFNKDTFSLLVTLFVTKKEIMKSKQEKKNKTTNTFYGSYNTGVFKFRSKQFTFIILPFRKERLTIYISAVLLHTR